MGLKLTPVLDCATDRTTISAKQQKYTPKAIHTETHVVTHPTQSGMFLTKLSSNRKDVLSTSLPYFHHVGSSGK